MLNRSDTSAPLRIGVLGSGKGSNCQSIIDAIAEGRLNARIACVISDNENAYILERAREHGVPACFISGAPFKTKLAGEAETATIAALRAAEVEVVVLAGFMRILKPALLSAFEGRILNIHPSLLPAFPGLEAWKQALTCGVKVTGCTVHFVDAGTDTGPIIIQRAVPVFDHDTAESLHARIQVEEHIAYPAALRLLAEGRLHIAGRTVVVRND